MGRKRVVNASGGRFPTEKANGKEVAKAVGSVGGEGPAWPPQKRGVLGVGEGHIQQSGFAGVRAASPAMSVMARTC